jgi:hypothetical protein
VTATEAIAAAILAIVNERGGDLTFALLEKEVAGFTGPLDFCDRDDPRILLRRGISAPAAAAIEDLIRRGELHYRRSTVENHAIDGRVLNTSTRPRATDGRCWTPVSFYAGSTPMEAEAAMRRTRR